jgi:hypothetical protein
MWSILSTMKLWEVDQLDQYGNTANEKSHGAQRYSAECISFFRFFVDGRRTNLILDSEWVVLHP